MCQPPVYFERMCCPSPPEVLLLWLWAKGKTDRSGRSGSWWLLAAKMALQVVELDRPDTKAHHHGRTEQRDPRLHLTGLHSVPSAVETETNGESHVTG